jgi:hypothetical protein
MTRRANRSPPFQGQDQLVALVAALAPGDEGSGLDPAAYWTSVLAPLLVAAQRSLGADGMAKLLRAFLEEQWDEKKIREMGRMPGG